MSKYITNRDHELVNKLHTLLRDAARSCPDQKVADLQENNIQYLNEDITEYVLVWFFNGRQVCVHRTIHEGIKKFGCDIIRVWERHLPNDKAVEQIGSEVHRMLGQRLKVRREIEGFERFAKSFKEGGMS